MHRVANSARDGYRTHHKRIHPKTAVAVGALQHLTRIHQIVIFLHYHHGEVREKAAEHLRPVSHSANGKA